MKRAPAACKSSRPACQPVSHPVDSDLLAVVCIRTKSVSSTPQATIFATRLTLSRSPVARVASSDPSAEQAAQDVTQGRVSGRRLLRWMRGQGGEVAHAGGD